MIKKIWIRHKIKTCKICLSRPHDRLLMVKLKGKHHPSIYADNSGEEVDDRYEKREQLLDAETKGKDYTVVMGNFTAVVEEGKGDVYVDHYGLGHCNDNGEMFVDFLQKKKCLLLIPGLLRTEHFPFILTLLVGHQEGPPVCKKLGVGLLVVTI